ncbi:flavin reductase family protein [Mechercharimyces sp. CAU 1602]|uniref:flavin reductase family protein n=1 Tax=Mechercharimyces sp. CAU 1602 TaxID=2973933 RepID=UPI0021635F7D|nr:flavin reductase family protein [Mechercharimyces sp. CAU 1602]MCS1352299.1 flavin reductase family protein [Mechercharimyces sp. CAU 1602]
MHKTINPKILYFGTPVVLVSTVNEDGTFNLAPISSAWWMSQSCMLGMSGHSQTVSNLIRTKECVLNLPSADQVREVDQLALLTGKDPVPPYKEKIGYTFEADKFTKANLTPLPAQKVHAARVKECPVQLEATVSHIHSFAQPSALKAIEVKIVRAHIDNSLLTGEAKDHIDPHKWRPLIMSFCEFFSLSEQLHPSRLAEPFLSQYTHKS